MFNLIKCFSLKTSIVCFFILLNILVHSSNAYAILGLQFIFFVLTLCIEYLYVKPR